MQISKRPAIALLFSLLGLTACSSNNINFERMERDELVAYNRSVDFWDQVYCVDEIRAGSHIRRRHCNTLLEIQNQVDRSASAVNVLSASRVY